MEKGRLEAFSDGVIAIIITIMVLELKVPHGETLAALGGLWPKFLSYVLSFIYVGIYWNNLHLLFWLSLIPFATGWAGETHFASAPTALYGVILFMSAIAYWILQKVIIAEHGRDSLLAKAIGRDLKGNISLVIYAIAVGVSFVNPWIASGLYVLVALFWLVPDRRIERAIRETHPD
jgi:uncharacterized membrane protein